MGRVARPAMRRTARVTAALACAAALIALAAPVGATQSVVDRNVAFLLDSIGLDAIPDGTATVHANGDVLEMTIADAMWMTAERAGDVDLATLAAAAVPPSGAWAVGDIWIIEIGYRPCLPPTVIAPTPLPPVGLHPQLGTYSGAVMEARGDGAGIIIDWTTKDLTGGAYQHGFYAIGNIDYYCVYFFGFTLYFPHINGYAEANAPPSGSGAE